MKMFNFTRQWPLFSEVRGNESDCPPFIQHAEFHQNSEVTFCCYKQPPRVEGNLFKQSQCSSSFVFRYPLRGKKKQALKTHTHARKRKGIYFSFQKDAVQKKGDKCIVLPQTLLGLFSQLWVIWSSANVEVCHVQFINSWREMDQTALLEIIIRKAAWLASHRDFFPATVGCIHVIVYLTSIWWWSHNHGGLEHESSRLW